ncbi:hypothetical protein CCP4SC76_3420008 [Gammaproteobacteria bacterium]
MTFVKFVDTQRVKTPSLPGGIHLLMDNFKLLIAGRIKQARERSGYTQEQLANMLGWTRARIGNYELGARSPGPEEAVLLANKLNVRAAWLLCIDDEDALTPDERALLGKYRATDQRGKDAIQGIANIEPPCEGGLKNGTYR